MDHLQLLKVIVGSQAHGLATPNSDTDYRGVFVNRTRDILSLGGSPQQTSWIEGKEDDTSWEVGKFLQMAVKCNPTVLEVFKAPILETTPYGDRLQALFPYMWNSTDVMNAFIGYSLNQRKKFLDDKDKRRNKYACAYLRTLYMAHELLSTNNMTVSMVDSSIYDQLRRWKDGAFDIGEVIDECIKWEDRVKAAYEKNPNHKPDLNRINAFLLEIRYFYW